MKMPPFILRKTCKKKKRSAGIRRRSILAGSIGVLASSLFLLTTAPRGGAATYYWDQDANGSNDLITGAGLGGLGTWSTAGGASWWNGTGLTPADFSLWNNAGNDIAIFTGTAGTVTLGSGITVGGLQFNTTAYTINTAANALTFGAANNSIVLNGIAAATITGSVTSGAGGNLTLGGGVFGGVVVGTLTLNGTSLGGWSGTTTINNGMTLALTQNNQALANTTGIGLNGGNITVTNASASTTAAAATTASSTLTVASATGITVGMTVFGAGVSGSPTVTAISGTTLTLSAPQTIANAASLAFSEKFNRIADAAPITANGGTLTFTNTVAALVPYAETIGAVSLASGRMNIVSTTANTGGTQVLNLTSLSQSGTASLAVSAGTALNATTNRINNAGFGVATTAGQIIAPWLTVGTGAATNNDYGVYDGSGNFLPAG